MKIIPTPPGALPRCFLAATLLTSLPLFAQTITNPSFEANTFTTFPGYISGAGNGPITGWTGAPTDRVGLNPSGGSPFANNGAIPDGTKVAFIQNNPTGISTLKTTVTDLVPGTKYNVSFRINARSGGTQNFPWMTFSTDGTGTPVTAEIGRVSTAVDATPYKYAAFEFTATGTSHEITVSNVRSSGDHTLLVDNFVIAPSLNEWAFSPWTGDADSGFDSQYVYTHAYSLGGNPSITINGVHVHRGEGGAAGRWTNMGFTNTFGNRTPNNVTGTSATMAKDFWYGGTNPGIKLENLKPSTQYVATFYGLGFDDPAGTSPHRSATFSSDVSGSQKFTVNVDHYGFGNGIKVTYTYTTDALGTPVIVSPVPHGSGTFHLSGFSNREAVASTPTPSWTTVPWNDDASSGIDNTCHYTHALNFGTTVSPNVNGIQFTGITGGNPAGANFTSTLPNQFTNDSNNTVSGYGSALVNDFVYGSLPEVMTLSGLTVGKQYVFTIYSTGWDSATGRLNAFYGMQGEGPTLINVDGVVPNNDGYRIEHVYTATATTQKFFTSSAAGGAAVHCYAISNREATPMVATGPSITLQPVGISLGLGANYTLRVGAIGSPGITYQWQRNNVDIDGATDPTFDLFDVDSSVAGDYKVIITNPDGTVTSNVATITVLDNVPGVFGSGLGHDGQPLVTGAIDPHFKLIVNPDNPASEDVLIQGNIPGPWLANSTTSKWIGPRADTAGAAAMAGDDGEGPGTYVYRTTIDLTGFNPSTAQITGSWATDNSGLAIRVNGTATGLVHDTGTTYGVLKSFVINSTNAPGLIAGINNIDFVVNNSDTATGFTGLRVEGLAAVGSIPPNTPPHIVAQPVGGNGPHNGAFFLSVAASGSTPLAYEWYRNDVLIDGETSATLTVPISDPTAAGNYKVKVTNGTGFVESSVATVTVSNQNPVAVDDEFDAEQDTPLDLSDFDLLANDTDADGDILVFTGVSATTAQGGSVTVDEGLITYTPPAGFTGLDFFTYTATDGVWGGSVVGNVYIDVITGASEPPGQLSIVVSGGVATGTFTGTPGDTYILQRSTNLTVWTDVDTEIAPPSGTVTVEDPAPPAGKAFYRISYTP
jgi:hypothetical protein